jgi:NADH-quinone oxidoreductase subunit C
MPEFVDAAPLVDLIRTAAPGATLEALPALDMPTIAVDRDSLLEVCRALRDDPALQFAFLADVLGVDLLPAEPRYEVVYHLACLGEAYAIGSAAPARRLRIKVRLAADDARLPSVVSIYPTAGWPEREVFDLFGIGFEGHPDLRRILMPDDWEGHPLRKDYPVQIRKTPQSWSPLQVSLEEFTANVRGRHEQALRDAEVQPRPPRD